MDCNKVASLPSYRTSKDNSVKRKFITPHKGRDSKDVCHKFVISLSEDED